MKFTGHMQFSFLALFIHLGSKTVDASRFKSHTGQKPNMDKVVETLMELAQGVDEEIDAAKSRGRKRVKVCETTITELQISIRDNNRNVVAAQQDLQGVSSEIEGLSTSVASLKKQIKAGAAEINVLTKKLKDMRKKKSVSLSQADTTLQQVEAVIRKAAMEEEAEKHKHRDSPLKAQVSLLHQLSTKLSSAPDNEPTPAIDSFLQTDSSASSKQGGTGVKGLLQADQHALMQAKDNADKGFDEEEAKFEELLKVARDEVKKLEESLAETQPSLGDKLRQSAEVNASRIMSMRGLARDKDLLVHVQAKCKFQAASLETLNALRFELSGLLKMPAKLLKKMDAMMFLARDLQSLKTKSADDSKPDDVVSFLQEGSQAVQHSKRAGKYREDMHARLWDEKELDEAPGAASVSPQNHARIAPEASDKGLGMVQEDGTNGGPFDDVTAMIKSLVVSLKDEANQDVNRQQWCADNQAENLNERINAKDELDTLTSEVRWATTAITRLDTEIGFLQAEVPRLQKAGAQCVKEIKYENDLVKRLDANHTEAAQILMKVQVVVKALCQIEDGKFLLLQRNSSTKRKLPHIFLQRSSMNLRSSRYDNCVRGVEIIDKALLKSQELSKAVKQYLEQFTDHVTAYKKKVDAAQVEQVASLNEASAAKAQRANELAKAEHDESQKKQNMKLLIKTKNELEDTCGPRVESHEERLQRRSDEIEALKNALSVLEGQAIPV
mmetsp:Transcript_36142/g.71458  ORF Transcript_36142/g.71458 Transcript_36142/m.71458 type:complete len:726 (+) Transcript_36142:92-2269(+)|eukprot:CAMPEP_0172680550 /NCGR_PEP_ID=MMETSP1074-20121228/16834_1 /TAXON_ID=2916 /ORGANISM="Ceratium fusus, Strain PA161109" /LENGTH=725 /DNA_ID=CAMNT_0013498893 /DNA_START=89 /DNA_END=2266 /DNA_ORIENTATION=-